MRPVSMFETTEISPPVKKIAPRKVSASQRQAFITQRIAILQHERTGIEQQFEDAHVV